ncbi:MAG: sulfite exporter TauE/SafE family protein [Thermaerobacter sp.]|nr:sulfite exporter TauE/SafE family protein [Thermaerobacter sp.]
MRLWVLPVAVLAGLLGGLLGLGGGVVLVPALSTLLGVPLPEAVGTSLIAVSATSISSSVAYIRQGLTDVELAISLVAWTSIGAIVGGMIGLRAGAPLIAAVFLLLALYTSFVLLKRHVLRPKVQETAAKPPRPGIAYPLMLVSGALSGLLGIGGGPVNVPVMNILLALPMKRAVATSSFMVGVTAATGGILYLRAGRIDPLVAGFAVIGVAVGAQIAGLVQKRISTRLLALLFAVVLVAVGVQMAVKHL